MIVYATSVSLFTCCLPPSTQITFPLLLHRIPSVHCPQRWDQLHSPHNLQTTGEGEPSPLSFPCLFSWWTLCISWTGTSPLIALPLQREYEEYIEFQTGVRVCVCVCVCVCVYQTARDAVDCIDQSVVVRMHTY